MRTPLSLALLVIVSVSCGGTSSPSPVAPSASSPTPIATATSALSISTPSPTAAPTTAPTPTPDPTLLVDVRSDADVERLFVGMTPDELQSLVKESADPSYRFPLPFDPHGVRFQLRTQSVRFGSETAAPFQILGVVLTSGSVTLKLHGPGVYALRREVLFESAGARYLVVPTDQDVFRQPMNVQLGTRGVFVEATPASEVLAPIAFGEIGAPATRFGSGLGTQIVRVDASMRPLGGPPSGVWPNSHIVIHGDGVNGYKNGAPMTDKSLLRAADGRIVYIRCQLQFDGSKWVQVCPGN